MPKLPRHDPLTIADAATYLQVTDDCVRKYCQSGRLGRKHGIQWLITRDELRAFARIPRPIGRPITKGK